MAAVALPQRDDDSSLAQSREAAPRGDRGASRRKRLAALAEDGAEPQGSGDARGSAAAARKRARSATPPSRAVAKYARGEAVSASKERDKKLRREIEEREARFDEAARAAAATEVLLPERRGFLAARAPGERTFQYSQEDIAEALDMRTRRKIFDLKLSTFAPYAVDYTRNGRFLLLGGRRGHLALMDWHDLALKTEVHVRETVRDVQFLHNESLFAVAQRRCVYIYDKNGLEVHCLRNHVEPTQLVFLPYHFLLVSAGKTGYIKWQDTSTGALVAEWPTKLGECDVLTQNPANAIVCAGHSNGQVTMWSPNVSTPLVRMLAHRTQVRCMAVDPAGRHMVTAGLDGQMRVWDLRTYKELHAYYTLRPAAALSISQTGLLAVGAGSHVTVWRDALSRKATSPYVVHELRGREVSDLRFCPFEDVLGVGHSGGFSSVVVPGAGEPNFDTFEANPMESKKEQREDVVQRLLDKVPPTMITLDTNVVGGVDRANPATLRAEREAQQDAAADAKPPVPEGDIDALPPGKRKALQRWLQRRKNIRDKAKERKRAEIAEQRRAREEQEREAKRVASGLPAKSALDRFKKKRAGKV
jgi:U3 small nucleolar RNA-associated protein 7